MSASIPDIVLRLARRELDSGPASAGDPLATWSGPDRPSEPQGPPDRAVSSLRSQDEEQNAAIESPPDAQVAVAEHPQLHVEESRSVETLVSAPPVAASSLPVVAASLPKIEDRGWRIESDEPGTSLSSIFYPPSSPSTRQPDLQINDADANEHPGAHPGATVNSPIPATSRPSTPSHLRTASPGNEQFTGPAATSEPSSGESATDRLSESVADQSRQLEQLSHNLESSLTRLFATQLETLDNLRQRLDEQERLWLEQQAVRRAALG